jgi:regulator of cell morphogenesis and NO signaling
MSVRPEDRVADLASKHPATIRVFQSHGIDFCCGGKRPLGEVCEERGLDLPGLTRELEAALAAPGEPGFDWERAPLREVVSQIVARYHRPLERELPRLAQMMQKVLEVHGARHEELAEVAATFEVIVADLGPHMMKEERVLFPFVARMEAVQQSGGALAGSPFGSVKSPIGVMESEHEAVAGALRSLHDQAAGFEPPEDACNTFRGLYHGFGQLERDLHEHIHVENNILFPRATKLEAELLGTVRVSG